MLGKNAALDAYVERCKTPGERHHFCDAKAFSGETRCRECCRQSRCAQDSACNVQNGPKTLLHRLLHLTRSVAGPSAPIPKFARTCCTSDANFGIKGGTRAR